jgi:HSP20 family protein
MASLTRRNQERREATSPPQAISLWDPFRLMREVMRWDPARGVAALDVEPGFAPSFEVKETNDAYLFRADLPGVKEDDVQISLTGNRLTISGQREEEQRKEGEQYYATEITYGTFTRSFTLPDGTDPEKIKAEMKNGVLTVSVPKKPEVQPRTIPLAKEQQQQVSQPAQQQGAGGNGGAGKAKA